MKDWKCVACGCEIKVEDDYEPEYCCSGKDCGCMGRPINPEFCNECEIKIFGEQAIKERDNNELHNT
ncbi:MAG: hypothetical protein K0Q53_144 [Massilibacillus sp.]|jgi:hypothetical protein|nr:hypothetical protein [Massilibacillus sp.]